MEQLQEKFDTFSDRVQEIRSFLDLIKQQKKFVADVYGPMAAFPELSNNEYAIASKLLINSKVQYNAVIISAYACFEHFIDDICQCYLELILKLGYTIDSISSNSSNEYLIKATEYLANPSRFPPDVSSQASVIESLYKVYCKNDSVIVRQLFLHHGANLKKKQISDLLRRLGIKHNPDTLVSERDVIDFASDYFLDPDAITMMKRKTTIIVDKFENLVEERNQIAHSWNQTNRQSADGLESYLQYELLLGKSIFSLVMSAYLQSLKVNGKLGSFGKAIAVYNDRILCINTAGASLSEGDYILCCRGNEYTAAQIKEMEIDHKPVKRNAATNVDIGLRLDRRIKNDDNFYYYMSNK